MSLQFIITSILFGILPEAIYITLFLIFAKNLKTKRLILFGLILLSYIVLSIFLAFSVWFHVLYTASIYFITWLLYRSELIDIFLVSLSILTIAISGCVCYFLIPNYWIGAIVNRLGLFLFVYFSRTVLRKFYLLYCNVWNRKPNSKIKSLTVRNISCVTLNLMLSALNILMAIFALRFQ